MISVQNISKHFGSIKAVDNISFEIQPGEVVGFLGPNGAGKSTAMRMITGFLPPNSGKITIGDKDMLASPVAAKKKVGYLPESAAIYLEMVVIDFLIFMARMRGMKTPVIKARLKVVTEQCQIATVLGRKIGDLSKGYRQRVGLAQALLHDPEILVLDEPTVGLDPNQIGEIRQLIKKIGQTKTILLSTHILSEVTATCQRVMIIKAGKIVAQGTPESLMNGSRNKITYRVALRADLEAIIKRFASFPHFHDLEVIKSEKDLHHCLVHCDGQSDMSEEIFDMAVKNSWRLSELVREQQSLEDVFKDLTQ